MRTRKKFRWLIVGAAVLLVFEVWAHSQIDPRQFGLDCSGNIDNAHVWNRLLAATGDNATFVLPPGCIDAHSTVVVSSRAGFKLTSGTRAQNGGGSNPPIEKWIGTSGGMWDFQANQAPTIEGFLFINYSTGGHLDFFIRLDGDPQAKIGTEGLIRYNSFSNQLRNPGAFSAVAISPISRQNHEKNVIADNDFYCSGSQAKRESDSGQIVAGSHTLTCSLGNCSFMVDAQVGDRVRVSYASGILDTTISAKTDDTHLEMTDAATSTQSNARVHFQQAYGNGILIGSTNAKHNTIERNGFVQCACGLRVDTGSLSAAHLGGYANDTLVCIGNITEPSELSYMEDESAMRDLYVDNIDAPLVVNHARNSNYNAESDGFFYVNKGARLTISASQLEKTPIPNSVVIRAANPYTVLLFSLGNAWSPGAATRTSLGFSQWDGVVSPQGGVISCGDFGIVDQNGNWTMPTLCGR